MTANDEVTGMEFGNMMSWIGQTSSSRVEELHAENGIRSR